MKNINYLFTIKFNAALKTQLNSQLKNNFYNRFGVNHHSNPNDIVRLYSQTLFQLNSQLNSQLKNNK